MGVTNFLQDKFASEWKLLSETENIVSYTPEFPHYEQQFKLWRQQMQSSRTNADKINIIRKELTALRKQLRLKGYDFSVGLTRLVFDGFRHDDSITYGFKRVVICFSDANTYWRQGSANHIELAHELENILSKRNYPSHTEFHYLWFLRTSKELIISGSATETKEDFCRLEARGNANPIRFLSAFKDLK